MSEDCAGVPPVSCAEQIAAADRAAITAFRDIMPKQAARLLSFGVRPPRPSGVAVIRRDGLRYREMRRSETRRGRLP
jgi:hypothetical protein